MKQYLIKFSAGIALAMAVCMLNPTDAKADINVDTMDIDVELQEDGSAIITQNWTTYVDDGTEYYLYYKDSGYLEFEDLSVSDDTQNYENIGDWDIDADFDEKAYKCGINPVDDGVELCWGISEYGSNHYTISYTMENLAASYSDGGVGIFYRFVNSGMEFFPTDVTLTIRMADGTPLSSDNASIWGFGYDGDVIFEDGAIRATTNSALEDDENITLLISLDSMLLNPVYVMEDDLQSVIDYAMEDSSYAEEYFSNEYGDEYSDDYYDDDYDYYDDDDSYYDDSYYDGYYEFGSSYFDFSELIFILPILFFAGIFVISVVQSQHRVEQIEKANTFETGCSYFSGIPNNGEIDASYVLAKAAGKCEDDAAIGVHFMKLMLSGAVEDVPDPLDSGIKNLRLHPERALDNARDRELLQLLNRIPTKTGYITRTQMNQFCDKHYEDLDLYLRHCEEQGTRWLKNHNCLKGSKCNNIDDLTEEGLRQMAELLGLHKYLKDMAGLSENDVNLNDLSSDQLDEAGILRELLPYAILFNCTEEYEQAIQIWYPYYYTQPIWQRCFMYSHLSHHYYHQMSAGRHNGHARADAVRNSSSASFGGGGHASFGGGGGFSGGGGGGHR